MSLPPLPPGAKIVGGGSPPARNADLFGPLFKSGVTATNGYRTQGDIARLRAQGYKPASNSLHLKGDAIDLTPGRSGLSMAQLEAQARSIANSWQGGKVINEGHHIHVQLPGWRMAPGTPGTPNSGLPDLPPGAKLTQRGSLKGMDLGRPSGKVIDGDTFGLSGGPNARLFGVDAFEKGQQGVKRSGSLVPLGELSRNVLAQYALPDASVTAAGGLTYGRPVVSLNRGGDAGRSLLDQGFAVTVPEYLKADPKRFNEYTQAERLARLNYRGAHGTSYTLPADHRNGAHDPWAAPQAATDGNGVAVFKDEPMPFQGLKPEVAAGYVKIFQDMNSKPEDLLAYAKANGFDQYLHPDHVRAAYADRAKTQNPSGGIGYYTPPRILTDKEDGATGSFLRGIADPINLLDEAGALVDTLGGSQGRENVWNSQRRFGDVLHNNLDQNRSILSYDDAYHPWARIGGQLTSGVLLPYGGGIRTPMGLAKLGGAEGAIAGFGAGEDWAARFRGTALGSVLGSAAGATLGRLGQEFAGSDVGNRLMARLTGKRASPDAIEQGIYDAAPILNDTVQNAGPTPAARSQPMGGVAAMRMDDAAPVLVGPSGDGLPPLPPGARLADDIAGISNVGQPLDAQSMASIFRGTDPRSLLPRPGNLVSNMDEASIANPDTFARLTAPNELDALGIRRLPSNSDLYKSQSVRGPLDMTQALRRHGGIQDQGGELSHLGIGEPRKLPFGGGEQFLGRLINNESGMPLDEATHKLWEMGYFPEFRERPTPADLVDRLRQEATGAGRFFHPDDLAEVADFEAAQAQRYALEADEAERGPIFEQVGSEISFDDLAANQPPASAYEDMPRLTGRVGNINLDKIERPEDVGQILDFVASKVGGFDAASRGRITNEETARLAADMGLTPEALLKRRPGQALNAEQAFAARNLLQGSLDQVGRLAKQAVGGNDADMLAFEKALLKHTAIQEQVAGATAEAGRALQQFKMVSGIERSQAKAIREFLKGAKEDGLVGAAEAIVDLMRDPAKANRFIAKATKPQFKDKLVELYYNSLLSGPRTHAVNIISNFATALGSLPEHGAAWLLGGGRALLGKAAGKETGERIYANEIGARAIGLVQGAIDGLEAAKYTFKTGNVPDLMSKVEVAQHEAISGLKGHVLRTPTRALSAEDEFFKAIARRAELGALATRRATMEGAKGEAFKARVSELVSNPPDDMLEQALDFARYQTFQRPVGDIAGAVMRAANAHPALKLVVPFVRTPTNILKYAAERSPAAPMLKAWRDDFMAGGARRDLAIARSTLGTGLGLYIMQLAAEGKITGGGPMDENARRIMRADGWQPYSIKMGDEWVSYQRLDPLAMTLGISADYVEKQSVMTERQRDEQAMLLVASVIQNLSDKTWLTGMSEALGAMQDPVRYGPSALRRTAAGIAVPAAVSQVASTIDESPRESKTVGEAIQARVPGLSDNLRPSLNAWGKPIERGGAVGPDIASSFYTAKPLNDPVNQEALRLSLKVSDPTRGSGEDRLDDGDFHALRMDAGGKTYRAFSALISSPEYQTLTDDQKTKRFESIKKAARKAAKGELFGAPRSNDPWTESQVALPLPKGARLPPLPPGARMTGQ